MSIDADSLKILIERELERVSDSRVLAHIRRLLVEPNVVLRDWDYGEPGERYPCWAVLNDDQSNTGIAYCEMGFGPRNSWGLIWLVGEGPMSMGMDSGWFPTFLDAFFESFAATRLPIWRVIKTDSVGVRKPITGEHSWDVAWEQATKDRKADSASRYDVWHAIEYGP